MNVPELHCVLVFQHPFGETEVCLLFCRRNASPLFPLHPGRCAVRRPALSSRSIFLSSPAWRTRLTAQAVEWQPALSAFLEESCCPFEQGGHYMDGQCGWSSGFLLLIFGRLQCFIVLMDGASSGRGWAGLRQVVFSIWNQPPCARARWNGGCRGSSHLGGLMSQMITEISNVFYVFRSVLVPSV